MIGHVYSNGQHSRLRLSVDDLEEFIMRTGWTSVELIEGLTDEGRQRIAELEAREYIEGTGEGLAWWDKRLISSEPALTPDA